MGFITKIIGYVYFGILSALCVFYPEECRYVDVNGQHLLYAVRGPEDGKPVVLLHGNGGSHKSMWTQAKQLALAGYRVYSLDSRGQGANPPLDEYHYADMAEDAYQFIRALELDSPAVYGWSDGGILALMLEMAHPGTASMIAVSGANLFPDCGPGFEDFKTWIIQNDTPLTSMMLSEPDINPADLGVIPCPALVTVGSEDMISVEHTRLISDNIPNSELVVVQGASHSSFIKRNPRMGRLLLDFLQRHNYSESLTPEHMSKEMDKQMVKADGFVLEHPAIDVADPIATAAWWCENLGFTVTLQKDDPAHTTFIVDASGRVAIEMYRAQTQPKAPDYASMDPLTLHFGFTSKNVEADIERLTKAGATLVSHDKNPGFEGAMMRDPSGIPIQFVCRGKSILLK